MTDYIEVHKIACPAADSSYEDKCWDGYTSDDYDVRRPCSECDGKGYLLAVSAEAIRKLIREEHERMHS